MRWRRQPGGGQLAGPAELPPPLCNLRANRGPPGDPEELRGCPSEPGGAAAAALPEKVLPRLNGQAALLTPRALPRLPAWVKLGATWCKQRTLPGPEVGGKPVRAREGLGGSRRACAVADAPLLL